MTTSGWVRLIDVADAPGEGQGAELAAGGRVIALFCRGGEYYALDGMCAHQGGPLGRGTLAGDAVACPWHGWTYDLATGCNKVNPLVRQETFPVRVADGAIWIELPDGDMGR